MRALRVRLHHLTLNTGHLAVSGESDVDLLRVAPVLGPRIQAGGGAVPGTKVTLEIPPVPAGFIFTLRSADGHPVCLNSVAWDEASAAASWPPVQSLYLEMTETAPTLLALGVAAPEMPVSVPWLTTLLLPGIAGLNRDQIGMLGDLERCIAVVALHARGLWRDR